MTLKELDKLRFENIEFFAQRYSELFGDYFDKYTTQKKRRIL